MWKKGIYKKYEVLYYEDEHAVVHIVPALGQRLPYFGSNKVINGELLFTYSFINDILKDITPLLFKFETLKLI